MPNTPTPNTPSTPTGPSAPNGRAAAPAAPPAWRHLNGTGGAAVEVLDEGSDGTWRRNGYLHRDDGPAVIYADGSEAWYQHGRLHRDDGPAITRRGTSVEWRRHGQLHRLDGPAIVWLDGTLTWAVEGRQVDVHNATVLHALWRRAEAGDGAAADHLGILLRLWSPGDDLQNLSRATSAGQSRTPAAPGT